MDNLNVLVEAKKELLAQLTNTILPNALDTMDNLYAEAKQETKGNGTLKKFQENLADIPKWNNYQIEGEVAKSVDTCGGCLDEMVAAVFVATVKIISSVRLSKDSRKVKLKIPTNDVFILGVYTNIAKRIYEDPYIFQELNRTERRKELMKRMEGVVEETVKGMLPLNQILKTYLNKNPADMMNTPTEAEVGGDDSDEEEGFPGSSEHPVEGLEEEKEENEEENITGLGGDEENIMGEEEGTSMMNENVVETKEIKFNDKIGRPQETEPKAPSMEDDDDFINSEARR